MTSNISLRRLIPAGAALLALVLAAPAAGLGTNDVSLTLAADPGSVTQKATIPAAGPFEITVDEAATYVSTTSVKDATTAVAYTLAAGAPATGEYSVAAGVYTFAAADAGKVVNIAYKFVLPFDLGYDEPRSFTATVTNLGLNRVDGVTVDITIPADWKWGGDKKLCTGTGAQVCTVEVGTLSDPPNEPTKVAFKAAPRFSDPPPSACAEGTALSAISATVVANGIPATATDPGNPNTDPPGNNTGSVGGYTLAVGHADLVATFTGPASASQGQTLSFTGTVKNNGPCVATGVVIQSGGSMAEGPSDDATCVWNAKGQCKIASLAVGASASFTASYVVPRFDKSAISGSVPNSIEVSADQTDQVSSNNSQGTETLVDGDASVGCSTGGVPGALALLGLGLFAWRRRKAGLVAALLLAPLVPAAQTPAPEAAAPAAEEKKAVVEEITVTGTRLRRKDLTTPAPVTVISKEAIIASGKLTVADFLQALPEQGNTANIFANNGGDGATRVDLRSLSSGSNGTNANRTLVLLNGRRMVAGGQGGDDSVDLSSIPSAAIERIEILKDGASAIYGSDAIAGVVNLITRRSYNGTDASATGSLSSRGDAKNYDVSISSGVSGEKSSGFLSLSYYEQESLLSDKRSWSKYALSYDYTTGSESRGGSPTLPTPKLDIAGGPRAANPRPTGASPLYTDLVLTCQANPDQCPTSASGFILDPSAGGAFAGKGWRPALTSDLYNFAATNYLVTPQRRFSIFGFADSRLSDNVRAYLEGSFANRRQIQQLAAEPMSFGFYGIALSKDSQYNPFGIDVRWRRRLTEANGRIEVRESDTFRMVGGLDGTLPQILGPLSGWFWDLSLNFGRSDATDTLSGNLNLNKVGPALGPSKDGVCYTSRDAGVYSGAIDGCIPFNVFAPAGSLSPTEVNGLAFEGPQKGFNMQKVVSAQLGGDLFRLMSDRPAGLALGVEYREVSGENIPDPFSVAFYSSGVSLVPPTATRGSYNVNEVFGELSIPIVSGMEFVDDLEAQLAGRVFKYNLFGRDSTYKVGGRYRPVRDVTLRATYSTAFRAPSVSELFGGTNTSADTASDPCRTLSGRGPGDPLYDNCTAHGVPPSGSADPQTQLTTLIGSNPNLKPETAKTFTVGLVLEPRWVKNLSATIDYYNIEVSKSINRFGGGYIVSQCEVQNNPEFCARVTRDSDGVITILNDVRQNIGGDKVSGLDLAARYVLPTAFGRFAFVFDGTYLIKRDQIDAGGGVTKGKDRYDLGVNPTWKFNVGGSYAFQKYTAGLTARYIGPIKECGLADGSSSGTDCVTASQYAHKVDSFTTFDLFLGYTLPTSYGKTSLTFGMQNVFDAAPPKIYSGIQQWSDWTYDALGRMMYVRLAHAY